MHELIRVGEYRRITLIRPLKRGGEGTVWDTDQSGLVAKTYGDEHHFSALDARQTTKLQAMVSSPPDDPTAGHHHVSIAWPCDLLTDANGSTVGFLMPKISGGKELNAVFNPKARRNQGIGISWLYLHTAAYNVAAIMRAVHSRGHVIGDVKSQNILVNAQALVSVVDTDSFQIRDGRSGTTFRCLVGSEGYTPPELIGVDLAATDQSELQDRFRLGVVIYQLLFMGQHPTDGTWRGNGDQPPRDARVQQGQWNFVPGSLIVPGPHTVPLGIVHPALQELFMRCFRDGWKAPDERPSAQEWLDGLNTARQALVPCTKVKTHYKLDARLTCYWCERVQQTGYDPLSLVSPTKRPAPPQGGASGGGGFQPSSPSVTPVSTPTAGSVSRVTVMKATFAVAGLIFLVSWCSARNTSDTLTQQANSTQPVAPAAINTATPLPEQDVRDIGAFITGWKYRWESLDPERYIQVYDDDFSGRLEVEGETYDRDEWYAVKKKYAKNKSWIRISVENAKIIARTNETVTLIFDQHYESSDYTDTTRKEIQLIRRGMVWKIWRETPLAKG